MTACMWKLSFIMTNLQRIIINITDSVVPLSSTEHFSIFQLVVLIFGGRNLTVLVHSHRSHQLSFVQHQVAVCIETADWHSQQLAGELSGAFSSWRARYFPLELVETKTELKEEWLLNLH